MGKVTEQELQPPSYDDVVESSSEEQLLNEQEQPTEQQEPHATSEPRLPGPDSFKETEYQTGLFEITKEPFITLTASCVPCWTWGTVNRIISSNNALDDIEVGELDAGMEVPIQDAVVSSWPYAVSAVVSAFINAPLTPFLGLWQRQRIRKKYGLPQNLTKDVAAHFCCHCCALSQDHREVLYRERHIRQGYALSQEALGDDLA